MDMVQLLYSIVQTISASLGVTRCGNVITLFLP